MFSRGIEWGEAVPSYLPELNAGMHELDRLAEVGGANEGKSDIKHGAPGGSEGFGTLIKWRQGAKSSFTPKPPPSTGDDGTTKDYIETTTDGKILNLRDLIPDQRSNRDDPKSDTKTSDDLSEADRSGSQSFLNGVNQPDTKEQSSHEGRTVGEMQPPGVGRKLFSAEAELDSACDTDTELLHNVQTTAEVNRQKEQCSDEKNELKDEGRTVLLIQHKRKLLQLGGEQNAENVGHDTSSTNPSQQRPEGPNSGDSRNQKELHAQNKDQSNDSASVLRATAARNDLEPDTRNFLLNCEAQIEQLLLSDTADQLNFRTRMPGWWKGEGQGGLEGNTTIHHYLQGANWDDIPLRRFAPSSAGLDPADPGSDKIQQHLEHLQGVVTTTPSPDKITHESLVFYANKIHEAKEAAQASVERDEPVLYWRSHAPTIAENYCWYFYFLEKLLEKLLKTTPIVVGYVNL